MLSVTLLLARQCLSLRIPPEKKAGNEENHHDRRIIQCWFSERAQNYAEAQKKKIKDLHENNKLNVSSSLEKRNVKGLF